MVRSLMASVLLVVFVATAPATASAAAPAPADPDHYTQTRYPIVLAHGFLGFKKLLGFINYWPGIPRALEKGGATVYVTRVSTVNSSEARGEQLIDQLERLRAVYGHRRFNLVGHSQGSLDARYVASVRPALVASVTSVGGPHDVSFLDNAAFTLPQNPFVRRLVLSLLEGLGQFLANNSGNANPVDGEAAMSVFSPDGLQRFNERYPIGLPAVFCGEGQQVYMNGGHAIHVWSWGGVAQRTNRLDPTDGLMAATGRRIDAPNDGLVTRCANHLGAVIRDDYGHNHLDLVNMLFGLVAADAADPKALFRAHANRMKRTGL